MKIESKIGSVRSPAQKVYDFIADFRNFNNVIPADKISGWEADQDSCRFKMDMLGNVKLNIIEREPEKLVKIASDPDTSQYNFTLWIQTKQVQTDDSRVKVTIEPNINQVLLGMVKSPLKQFVDSLIDEIEKFDFQS
ncbi:MAG: hypothetical protein K9J30_12885 [Bacteroidales bacterium]|nr:hypothetical protein [Bacteroidales bacterium]